MSEADKVKKYWEEFAAKIDATFRAHPQLYDHRKDFPWLTGALGDPFAGVFFVAENPSLTQVKKVKVETEESQWYQSPGDKLFRQMLLEHGFKTGTIHSQGGWRCYITNLIKLAEKAEKWKKQPPAHQQHMARLWAPVLAWELQMGQPRVVVSVGRRVDEYLSHLATHKLLPKIACRIAVDHYTFIAMRPDPKTGLGPMHPQRIDAYRAQFAKVRDAVQPRQH